MADYRTIKKETYDDEKLADFPFGCRWLYIGLWLFADDNGIIKSSAKYIKPKVFPYDDSLRITQVEEWLKSLEDARMLIPLTYKNESYYAIRTFLKHQKIDKRWARYVIPEEVGIKLIEEATYILAGLYVNEKKCPEQFSADEKMLTLEEKRREEIRREEKGGENGTEEDFFSGSGQNQKKGNPPGSAPPPFGLPWDTGQFLCQWNHWKDYLLAEHKETYKSAHSEQAALMELTQLAEGKEDVAIKVLLQSMSKRWKGLFTLKDTDNGKRNHSSKQSGADYLRQNITSGLERLAGDGSDYGASGS